MKKMLFDTPNDNKKRCHDIYKYLIKSLDLTYLSASIAITRYS